MTTERPQTLVVGFGNPLMSDDGLGHAVVAALCTHPVSEGMRVEACAGDGLTLVNLWRGEPRVWIVDALVRNSSPGSVHLLEHDEIEALAQPHETVHQLSLSESLRLIAIGYPEMKNVRYRLWGVEPYSLRPGRTLSSQVTAAVSEVARQILDHFRKN